MTIIGAGGSKPRKPKEAADTLDSAQYATVLDLISEGEIEGLKDGHKSIFLDNTPLMAADGSYNFENVTVETRNGTQDQTYIPQFSETKDPKNVGVTVLQATPVVRTITDNTTDAVKLTISVPQLQAITSKGDIVGTSISLEIAVEYNGGGYTTIVSDSITGRSADLYQKDYLITLSGDFPVNIKVTRITPDSTTSSTINEFIWSSFTEIVYAKLRYPNAALVGIKISAEQFSRIPQRSYLVRGIKVQIPSNGTVDQTNGRITYSGVWNGTFGAAVWTTDPAWILWDLLTSTRYGVGDHINASQLDKWAFYAASQYASELVDDGFNGQEPRFSCNTNIQTQEEVFKVINDMCSVFRAMPYWSTGALTVAQDRPADTSYLFTLSNVTEEGFSYSSGSLKTRPTVAVVSYLDLDLRDVSREVVEDQDKISKYGVVSTEISAFATTSRSQARRLGEWLLYAEWNESEIVTFTASVDAGVIVRPGQVIEIADPMVAGSRRGGRIHSASSLSVTVDDAADLTLGVNSKLSVILPNGAVETKSVSSITENVITVSQAFSTAPNSNSVWVYQTDSLKTTTWRVLGVEEKDDISYGVVAMAYDRSKYDYIERNQPLQARDITDLTELPKTPTNISFEEVLYVYQAEVRAKIIVSWQCEQPVSQYEVYWRKDLTNWEQASTTAAEFELLNITPGFYEFKIYSVSALFKLSVNALTGNINALGKTAPPEDVPTFSAVLEPDVGVTLYWNAVSDLDLQGYEIWQGPAFGSGFKIGVIGATSKKLGLVGLGTTSWYIKALDTSGVYSTNAKSASVTVTAPSATSITGAFVNDSLILNWLAVSGSLSTAYYEVRHAPVTTLNPSPTWGDATVHGTVQGTTYAIKGSWSGIRRFFVAAVDITGNVGAVAVFDALITPPSQPAITQQVIDNNVLLQWHDSTQTLPIVYYELRKGSTWAGGTVIGTKQGKFTTVFEAASGTYTYWLAGIDSAGNYGTPGSVSALVNQPPDYVLKLDLNSDFSGIKVNTTIEDGALIAAVNTTETWQSHFTSRSWTTLQDQIDAGYSYYVMPTENSGSYLEEIDYGAVLAGTRVSTVLTGSNVIGSTTVTPTIRARGTTSTAATYSQTTTTITVTSNSHGLAVGDYVYLEFTSGTAADDTYVVATSATNSFTVTSTVSATTSGSVNWIKWTSFAGLDAAYVTNFRYLRIEYAFSGSGGNDIYKATALNVRLDSKLINDSGTGYANSGDTGGTVVTFNTTFIDVDSITVTPQTTSAVIAVYDFTDTPNPTDFKVLLFDTSGTRVSGTFSWSARGV